MTQPNPAVSAAPSSYPGKTMGIVGLVLAFVMSIAGIIVSAVGLHESKVAGQKNPFAVAGLAVSIVFTVAQILAVILGIVLFAVLWNTCGGLGNGVHIMQNGSTITCRI
jgi:hypothetical protein